MAIKSKSELQTQIRNSFNEQQPQMHGLLRLPSKLDISLEDDCLHLHLARELVCENLQKDNSAFEGWAFVLRRWVKKTPVIVKWDPPEEKILNTIGGELSSEGKHYQRFLYRVKRMSGNYDWFSISEDSIKELEKLKIVESDVFYLNSPDSMGASTKDLANDPNGKKNKTEEFIERKVQENPETMLSDTGLEHLYFQLPVGVFSKRVARENAIFTGGKSAIDLWGVNNTSKHLAIFELKDEKNKKVGIISELMFYANVVLDTHEPNPLFKYQLKANIAKTRGSAEAFETMKNAEQFDAYFLAPSFHPLIDDELIKDMNLRSGPGKSKEVNFKMLTLQEEYRLKKEE